MNEIPTPKYIPKFSGCPTQLCYIQQHRKLFQLQIQDGGRQTGYTFILVYEWYFLIRCYRINDVAADVICCLSISQHCMATTICCIFICIFLYFNICISGLAAAILDFRMHSNTNNKDISTSESAIPRNPAMTGKLQLVDSVPSKVVRISVF